MHTGSFAAALRDDDAPVGAWSTIGHPVVAELLADEFEFVVLDGEHSENTIDDLAAGVRAVAASDGNADAVVRVSDANPAEIRRVLDLGPAGVVVPQLESVADAREAVDAAQYPPEGSRGVAGGRASNYGRDLDTSVDRANSEVATVLQIETPGAVEDVHDIPALDGVDALFVGPADLSARLDCFGEFDAPAFRDAIDTVVAAASDAGVPVGTLATSPDQMPPRRDDWDMDFLVAGTDVTYLRHGASAFRD